MQIRRETSAWSKHRVREANYRDVIFLRSAGSDLKRLIPFALVSLIPFSSLLLPGIIYFYPQFLPRIFYTDKVECICNNIIIIIGNLTFIYIYIY